MCRASIAAVCLALLTSAAVRSEITIRGDESWIEYPRDGRLQIIVFPDARRLAGRVGYLHTTSEAPRKRHLRYKRRFKSARWRYAPVAADGRFSTTIESGSYFVEILYGAFAVEGMVNVFERAEPGGELNVLLPDPTYPERRVRELRKRGFAERLQVVTEPLVASSVSGRVLDAGGGVVPGATVDLQSATIHTSDGSVVTDDLGRFQIRLPSGASELRIAVAGFRTLMLPVRSGAGAPAVDAAIVLSLGSPHDPGIAAGVWTK